MNIEYEGYKVEKGPFSGALQLREVTAENLARVLARCVDGRYFLEDAQEAPLAVPGADAGIFAVVWSTLKKILGAKILDRKNDIISGYMLIRGGVKNLRFHVDNHDHSNDDSKNPLKGCGYMGVLHNFADNFGFKLNDIEVVDSFVERAKSGGAKIIELQGDHNEEAVVEVNRASVNVLNITEEGKQVFVYNKALLQQFFQNFWEEFIKMLGLDSLNIENMVEESMKTMDQHVETTLVLLNVSDKPKIAVD